MSAISGSDLSCKTYQLSGVNGALKQRVEYITQAMESYSNSKSEAVFSSKLELFRQLADDLSDTGARVEELSKTLDATRVSIAKVTKMPTSFPSQTISSFGAMKVTVTQNFHGVKEMRATLLGKLEEKRKSTESELSILQPQLAKITKDVERLRKEIGQSSHSSKSCESLETLVRTFQGDKITKVAPEFNRQTCINERFNSFVNDVRRPLLSFTINGQKVFDKSKMKDTSDKSIRDTVVADLGKHNLCITDFYKVLEFFHQGGTTQGYAYFTEKVAANGLNPTGIGPEATVELTIRDGKLHNLVSTAYYVIANADEAEPGVCLGIVEAEGKKQCTTIYDFVKEDVKFTVAKIPFAEGEVSELDAKAFSKG